MAVLATLKKDRLGEWTTLAEFLADLRRRETNSVAALALALSLPPEEQRELAHGGGLAVLVEVACDLRLPKGSRLAAARCAVEAGASGETLAALFVGAGDLATDPRLGAAAKKLVESGLAAALAQRAGAEVSLEAGAFARAAHAGASAVGQARLKELIAAAPKGHAGAAAALFSLGAAELGERERWAKLLQQTCFAHRSAPGAAKRLGLAPPWPPNLPDAFAPLVQEAEKAAAGVTAPDAAAAPVRTGPRASASPRASGRLGPPLAARPGGSAAAHAAAPPRTGPASLPAEPAQVLPRTGPTEVGRKVVAPIKPSLFRRPRGTLVEGPVKLPPKPMPPVAGRAPESAQTPSALGPLPPEVPEPRPIRRAAVAAGPFAQRLQSLFDDRPEAVERLYAAMEARAAVSGLPAALEELDRELSQPRWKGRRAPPGQLERLAAAARAQPEPWTAAAGLLLTRLRIEGA
ncbi:MAG TPA: hypothetical protein VEQ15_10215 [Myxococcales bacterium]|nr:hypothetical protein [Myxococcales bacterium]